jgi:hypothetical protein
MNINYPKKMKTNKQTNKQTNPLPSAKKPCIAISFYNLFYAIM